eukprot:7369247-Pyramimonas_sp.AAC.1
MQIINNCFSPSDCRPLDATAERLLFLECFLRTRSVALLQPKLRAKIENTFQDSNNTTSFANLARAVDRFQSSGFNRQARLMILNPFL